eukprot:UN24879
MKKNHNYSVDKLEYKNIYAACYNQNYTGNKNELQENEKDSKDENFKFMCPDCETPTYTFTPLQNHMIEKHSWDKEFATWDRLKHLKHPGKKSRRKRKKDAKIDKSKTEILDLQQQEVMLTDALQRGENVREEMIRGVQKQLEGKQEKLKELTGQP